MTYLCLEGIQKTYQSNPLFENFSFQAEEGEFLVLLGPSGCGKSTILRLIAGLEPMDKGNISLGGQNITSLAPAKRNIAMVFQNYALYPHMTVRKNLCFPLKMAKISPKEQEERVKEIATILELTDLLERKPAQLSGGQMQRVAVGRAIIRRPALFLLDEPLSNLDTKLRQQLRIEFKNLHQKLGITTLYVTHDQTEAMTLGDRILLLKDGKIQQMGSPLELYNQPANTFVASFLGNPPINLIPDSLIQGSFETEKDSIIGIRPEHFTLITEPTEALFEGKVLWIEKLGSETIITFQVQESETKVTMKIIHGDIPKEGEKRLLGASKKDLMRFNITGTKIL